MKNRRLRSAEWFEGLGGYRGLYVERVLQADRGCDFDFLVGRRGAAVGRHSH